MALCQESTEDPNPRKKCSSTFPLQSFLLTLFVIVLGLFVTGITMDVLTNYREPFYEYNYVNANQFYDYLPQEQASSEKEVTLKDDWDLKRPYRQKAKRGYFVDFKLPWVMKSSQNSHENLYKPSLQNVFTEQAKNRNSWKTQTMMNDGNTFFDHISHLFPYHARAMGSTDQMMLWRTAKAFFPMSTDAINHLNARNKQLLSNAMKTSEDEALIRQLQYLLDHFLVLPMKKEDFFDKTKLIRKRYSSFLPNYVGRIYNRMNTNPSQNDEALASMHRYYQNKKRKQLKWALFRNFPSLILGPPVDKIKIKSLIDNADLDPRHQVDDDFDTGQKGAALRYNVVRRNQSELSGELTKILLNIKDRRLPYKGNIHNVRFT